MADVNEPQKTEDKIEEPTTGKYDGVAKEPIAIEAAQKGIPFTETETYKRLKELEDGQKRMIEELDNFKKVQISSNISQPISPVSGADEFDKYCAEHYDK